MLFQRKFSEKMIQENQDPSKASWWMSFISQTFTQCL